MPYADQGRAGGAAVFDGLVVVLPHDERVTDDSAGLDAAPEADKQCSMTASLMTQHRR
jgi:hypothetical protein